MKKTINLLIILAIFVITITGCSKSIKTTSNNSNNLSDINKNQSVSNSETIELKNGYYANSSYNNNTMVNIIGEKLNMDTNIYYDKSIGLGFKYVETFGILNDEKRIEGACTPPYSIVQVYYSNESNNISEQYPPEIFKDMSEEEKEKVSALYDDQSFWFAGIFRYPENDENAKMNFEFFSSKYENVDRILDFDGATYYFGYNTNFSKLTLTTEEKTKLSNLVNEFDKFKNNIFIYPAVKRTDKTTMSSATNFNCKTLTNKTITENILKKYDFTIVNVWSTSCGPCINEMPQLQVLYEKLPENVNLLSVCSDGEDDLELAKQIINDSNCKFDVLLPDENLKKSLINNITAVPTTLFLNKNGIMIAPPKIGVKDTNKASEEYLEIIDEIIKNIEKIKEQQ